MPNCKFCGQPVAAAPVYHPECLEKQAAGGWISVEDRLPELEHLGLKIIVSIKRRYDKPRTDVLFWWGSLTHQLWQDVTHWMPLPEPPKEE